MQYIIVFALLFFNNLISEILRMAFCAYAGPRAYDRYLLLIQKKRKSEMKVIKAFLPFRL